MSAGIVISRFRCRNHRLGGETGDWSGTEYEGRYDCSVCDVFECENHILFECIKYDDLRERLITPFIDPSNDHVENLEILVNSTDKRTLYNLNNFIVKYSKRAQNVQGNGNGNINVINSNNNGN